MPIMFNTILRAAGLEPKDVRLLRHQDQRSDRGRSPYDLWRNDLPKFEEYQATQRADRRPYFHATYWASFVGTPDNNTIFAGIFSVESRSLIEVDRPLLNREGTDKAGTCDFYGVKREGALDDLVGKLFVEWGSGTRSWVQLAHKRDKPVKELRIEFKEPAFPGFLKFKSALSDLENRPSGWVTTLQSSRGVYLLTCPKTKEQYVGSASGGDGFWGRWQSYTQNGHGGNIALKSRNPSDYQVSILEVAGTAATLDDILNMETLWKAKLQSQEMGLNRN